MGLRGGRRCRQESTVVADSEDGSGGGMDGNRKREIFFFFKENKSESLDYINGPHYIINKFLYTSYFGDTFLFHTIRKKNYRTLLEKK